MTIRPSLVWTLALLAAGGLGSCELDAGDECTDVEDIRVEFTATARFVDASGAPLEGGKGYITSYKDTCGGERKAVPTIRGPLGPTAVLVSRFAFNLRDEEDVVHVEAGFEDGRAHAPATRSFSYSQLKARDGQTMTLDLEVRAQ